MGRGNGTLIVHDHQPEHAVGDAEDDLAGDGETERQGRKGSVGFTNRLSQEFTMPVFKWADASDYNRPGTVIALGGL